MTLHTSTAHVAITTALISFYSVMFFFSVYKAIARFLQSSAGGGSKNSDSPGNSPPVYPLGGGSSIGGVGQTTNSNNVLVNNNSFGTAGGGGGGGGISPSSQHHQERTGLLSPVSMIAPNPLMIQTPPRFRMLSVLFFTLVAIFSCVRVLVFALSFVIDDLWSNEDSKIIALTVLPIALYVCVVVFLTYHWAYVTHRYSNYDVPHNHRYFLWTFFTLLLWVVCFFIAQSCHYPDILVWYSLVLFVCLGMYVLWSGQRLRRRLKDVILRHPGLRVGVNRIHRVSRFLGFSLCLRGACQTFVFLYSDGFLESRLFFPLFYLCFEYSPLALALATLHFRPKSEGGGGGGGGAETNSKASSRSNSIGGDTVVGINQPSYHSHSNQHSPQHKTSPTSKD